MTNDEAAKLNPGLIVIVESYTGTQIAKLIRRERAGGWICRKFSASSKTWTKTERWIGDAQILGSAGTRANTRQRKVLGAAKATS